MIGTVGTVLGAAGLNISDMDVGRGPGGDAALMVLSLDSPVPAEVVAELSARAGILLAQPIELD
jgi:D-3-phosphoglycerate dehydrogenase